MRRDAIYTILALAVLLLAMVPIGTAVFLLGFIYGDSPCVMCWEQRSAMALIALIGLFILRYGPRPKYIGLSVIVGAWGMFMSMRHVGMHAARDVGQGFSLEILGAHTYTWALFIFWVSVVAMGALLMMLREPELQAAPRRFRPLESLAMGVFLVVIAGNIVQAFASTGPPPYVGQGDPIRFSFNPKHWVWSMEEYSAAPMTLRGRWASEEPDVRLTNGDPAAGPLADLPVLAAREERHIGVPLQGTVTDLAYDANGDRFLLTTQHGVYILDESLSRILRYTIVDPGYSVDLGRFAGAAFLDLGALLAVGENKSFVILKESDKADADRNFRYFLESSDRFNELSRSRFGTVRARMMYTMSVAYDLVTRSIYTVTVPNTRVKRLVVSRFDRRDLTLSEEFTPTVSPTAGLMFAGRNRSLDELYITGTAIADGRMYAISAAYGTLLTIDLAAHTVVAAHTVAGLSHPVGLAIKGADLYVAGDDGRVWIVAKPAMPAAGAGPAAIH